MCASLVLRVFLYLAHIQGELVPSIAKIASILCKSLGLSSNTKKGEIERTISSHDVFGVKMTIPTVFLTVLLSFRGNVVDVSFYCDGCSLVIF